MVNLILILLLINSIFAKRNTLYCGIFGWVGTETDKFSITKIKVLGAANDDRGGDGFGLFNSVSTFRSTNPSKFKEGMKDLEMLENLVPKDNPVFIGHSRKKSSGFITMEYTQPISYQLGNVGMTLAHNGTISNLRTVAADLGIAIPTALGDTPSDTQILTFLLLHQITNNKPMGEILAKYDGTASLVFHLTSEPRSLYFFRGECATYKNGPTATERPLYMLKEKGSGVFVSSVVEPLDWIIDSKSFEHPTIVPANTVLKITGDKVENFEKVNRTYVEKEYFRTNTNSTRNNSYSRSFREYDYHYDEWDALPKTSPIKSRNPLPLGPMKSTIKVEGDLLPNALRATPTLDYLQMCYIGLDDIAEKFNNDYQAALDYVAIAFPAHSIINKFITPFNGNSPYGRIYMYRGRYLLCRTIKGKNYSSLANGQYYLNKLGNIVKSKDASTDLLHSFVGGVKVINSGFDKALKATVIEIKGSKISYFSFNVFHKSAKIDEANRQLGFDSIYGLIMPLHTESGVTYQYASSYLIRSSGIIDPMFSVEKVLLDNGYAKSTQQSDRMAKAVEEDIDEIENTSYKAIEFAKKETTEVLCKCPTCNGDDFSCDLCDGEGYISDQLIHVYKQEIELEKEAKKKEDDTKIIPMKNHLNVQADEEIISIVRELGNSIQDASSKLDEIGVQTVLFNKSKMTFEEVQDALINLIGYDT